jgi:hypothetical protein
VNLHDTAPADAGNPPELRVAAETAANVGARIDTALAVLVADPALTPDHVVDAVLGSGQPAGWARDDLRLAVHLRVNLEPLPEGVAGALQREGERRLILGQPWAKADVVRFALRAHRAEGADVIAAGVETYLQHEVTILELLAGQLESLEHLAAGGMRQ